MENSEGSQGKRKQDPGNVQVIHVMVQGGLLTSGTRRSMRLLSRWVGMDTT